MHMKKLTLLTSLIALFAGTAAHAEFSVVCGKDKERGPEHADLAILDSLESTIKFYMKGKKLGENDFGIQAAAGEWLVTVYSVDGKNDRKFAFNYERSEVQEFRLDPASETKVGAPKKCDWKEVEEE